MILVDQHVVSSCLRLVCETNVVEILREAGPQVSPPLISAFPPGCD